MVKPFHFNTKINSAETRKIPNPDLSDKTQRHNHSNKSFQWVRSDRNVFVIAGESLVFLYKKTWTGNMVVKIL